MAFCYPQGSSVKSVMWNWKSNVKPAASYEDMMARSYNYTWNYKGDGMYFWDEDAGYLWVRVPPFTSHFLIKLSNSL